MSQPSKPSPTSLLLFALALALFAATGPAQAQPDRTEVTGNAFRFVEVADGVWHVLGTGTVAVGSNGALIVSDDDLLLVDSHMTPTAARALLEDLPRVTDKPIRYVVNTHFHFDHVQGNQVFGPEVEIVAHEFTRERIAAGDTRRGRGYDMFVGGLPKMIQEAEARLPELEGEERASAEQRIAGMRAFWEQDQEADPPAPTLALRESITLYRGNREIRIFFLGRGHTGGDVVVYLPADGVLVTGDLMTNGLPYMGDGFLREWADTLEPLKELQPRVILPGHGEAFEEVEKIGHLQAYLRELWSKAVAMHEQGISVADAAVGIDMSAHAKHFPQIEGPGVSAHAIERIYELLDAE
jgi:glyoxylase-like metal-dependent hydrolase (beta-lactamase superfamily II)